MANRNLRCNDCGGTKWLSQKQWKKLVELHGTHRKAKRRFRCVTCRSLERKNPFEYQLRYGAPVKKLRSRLRKLYRDYYRGHNNIRLLQQLINETLVEYHLDPTKVAYHQSGAKLAGITLREVPFVGELYISLYTSRQKTY